MLTRLLNPVELSGTKDGISGGKKKKKKLISLKQTGRTKI